MTKTLGELTFAQVKRAKPWGVLMLHLGCIGVGVARAKGVHQAEGERRKHKQLTEI